MWQRGVGLAPESCLQHGQPQCSEPAGRRGRELDGEPWSGGLCQVSESSSHTSPDKAQHPPLQGKNGRQQPPLTPPVWVVLRGVGKMRPVTDFSCVRQAYQYGVYTRELLQFGDKMSMLLLLPPSEDFSSSYWPLVGTKEPGLTMPLQIFELGRWRCALIRHSPGV